MTMTTIKVSTELRNRLRVLAERDGVTLAGEIERLIEERSTRPLPTIGGFRSGNPLTAEQIDEALASGFGQ